MERKKTSALISLWAILLASFALVAPIPPASAPAPGTYRYWVMPINRPEGKYPGNVVINDSINDAPPDQGVWNLTVIPLSSCQNITFSQPWFKSGYGWIVNLTVPQGSYKGINHTFYDKETLLKWIRFTTEMTEDGHGWVFLNATGDVDCHTFSNRTALWWRSPSPKAGKKAAILTDLGSSLPSPGPDGIPGTGDSVGDIYDGFGDGNPDPPGSSLLILPTNITAYYYDKWPNGTAKAWTFLFEATFPQVFTTGNASCLVKDPGWTGEPGTGSPIDTAYQTEVGQPWEFYAGLDHPGEDGIPHTHDSGEYEVPWAHQNSTAYVTYICAWSMIDTYTDLGDYDICYKITERKLREDCLLTDISGDELVDIEDIVACALAFDGRGQSFGMDGKPYTADDRYVETAKWDARMDWERYLETGVIDIGDVVTIALDFGAKLTPQGIKGRRG